MIEDLGAVVERFTADGAYDTRAVYGAIAATNSGDPTIMIPPKRTAAVDPHATGAWRQRNVGIERIAEVGRRQWRKESGAHRQAGAENGMYRYKRTFGDSLRARRFDSQKREAALAVNVLNRMAGLGMPCSVTVAR